MQGLYQVHHLMLLLASLGLALLWLQLQTGERGFCVTPERRLEEALVFA